MNTVTGPKFVRNSKVTVCVSLLCVATVCTLLPIYWLAVASGKSSTDLFRSSTFIPGPSVHYLGNVKTTFTYDNGVFIRWLVNSAVFALSSAILAVYLAASTGYLLAFFSFRGRTASIAVVIASLAVPATAMAVPTFILEARTGLTNTYLGVILPLSLAPFGVFFFFVYSKFAIPATLLDAARVDGLSEIKIFHLIALRLLRPGLATLFLLVLVAGWNNYFLPLVLLSREQLFPATEGLGVVLSQVTLPHSGPTPYIPLLMGSVLSILPMLIVFPFLQRLVSSGLTAGALVGE